jgi:hypothetical protein
MDNELFPSGPWTGFYNYTGPEDRHRMDLHLAFTEGRMSGDGIDEVGRFLIAGRYDVQNRECWWTKTYPGSHDVSYRGFAEGNGIWGTWEIPPWSRGGFHIWPRHSGNGAHERTEAEIEMPSDQKTVVSVVSSDESGHENPSPGDTTSRFPWLGSSQRESSEWLPGCFFNTKAHRTPE